MFEIQVQIALIAFEIAPQTVVAVILIHSQAAEAIAATASHKAPKITFNPSHSKNKNSFKAFQASVIAPERISQAEEKIVVIAFQVSEKVHLIVSQAPDQSPPRTCKNALNIQIQVQKVI